jgi:hypothetical protein
MNNDKWSYSGKLTGYQLCCGGYEECESGNAKIVLECPNSTTYIVFVKLADKVASYGFDTLIQARMFIGRVKQICQK